MSDEQDTTPVKVTMAPYQPFFPEGEMWQHPSGFVYQRVKGQWKAIRYPDGTPIEEPKAT